MKNCFDSDPVHLQAQQSLGKGRSSDLFRLRRLPNDSRQWQRVLQTNFLPYGEELTAAGTVLDSHQVSFSPLRLRKPLGNLSECKDKKNN
jgi:hypothetical protein